MINHLDNLLRHLFRNQIAGITTDNQVRFQPPDQDWRTYVAGLGASIALNVYLVELRENRKLRSNERVRQVENGVVTETPAPTRLDCHYLITAWSPAIPSPALEPTVDEHTLLYDATAALLAQAPLNPARIYPANDPDLLAWPTGFRDMELPTAILPVETFPKYAEFWGTMGQVHPWKPAVYLLVTLPVAMPVEIAGPPVTTLMAEYGQTARPETAEVWVQIGGTVTDPMSDPAPGAWVRLEPGEHTVITDAAGRFTFVRLRSGAYTLTVRASGFDEWSQPIQVPSPGGGYDVQLI